MGVQVIGYKEPEGLRVAYTNPGSHLPPTIKAGEIKYHYSNNRRHFDFIRHFVPGQVVSEHVHDGNIKWRRYKDVAELKVDLGKEDYLEVSWFEGRLHKGTIHHEGKKDIHFNSMFGEYGLEYKNLENGHIYGDLGYSSLRPNIRKGEAGTEIYQLFVAPYTDRISEYVKVLDTKAPIKWHRRRGEAWLSPVLPVKFSSAAMWLKRRMCRDPRK